ncbi:hypothetical protein F4678DRAFT_459468 [Xylaria arbuscula]|nr:hypothetical protein F4678DRAFT_459468 [Xylaria arbuscula]
MSPKSFQCPQWPEDDRLQQLLYVAERDDLLCAGPHQPITSSQALPSPPSTPAVRHTRVPLPVLSPSPTSRKPSCRSLQVEKQRKKTENERTKGLKLNDDLYGADPVRRCASCEGKNVRCRVAREPGEFKSYKCGHCISSKLKCSFSHEHPGIPYDSTCIVASRPKEETKKSARRKARAAVARNRLSQKTSDEPSA